MQSNYEVTVQYRQRLGRKAIDLPRLFESKGRVDASSPYMAVKEYLRNEAAMRRGFVNASVVKIFDR